ncbi:ATPase [Bifidobacterium catulorum]|uniref:Sensor-like histidine kinase SenX3 n=2 Tax=Bifidobacterium catulorum TaxID=1630173 RepID=A0A2U2MUW3_9BIFI|nr:ATPase [Bifidobacterium catulorum]
MGYRRSHGRDDDDDDDDELDYETRRLLAVIPSISIIVNDDDEVMIAGAAAYRLGIVDDERIVNDRVLNAIHSVRESGGKRSCELVTETSKRFVDPMVDVGVADGGDDGGDAGVSRPNWLKVTVGQISDGRTVVLINDVSEERRFARMRDDFVSNVTEQLLKPTKALETLGEDLEQDDVDIDQILTEAAQVRRYADHLGHLVSDLLLLIKAQSKVVPGDANRVNLLAQVREVADRVRPEAVARNVRLVVNGDDTLMVHAEAEQLQGALGKLMENAVEYSRPNSAVGVAVSASKDGEHAVVRVVDQGCGISREDQARIFERFYRGGNQSAAANKEGVGLGLAIVKHVALTHHGSVSVWSAPNKGSTFTLTLPRTR